MYSLIPTSGNLIVIPLKPKEVKEYTNKVLSDVETSNMDVIQYGRVVQLPDHNVEMQHNIEDIILYQKLASHKTNFGDPRQVIVPIKYIEAYLKESK